jgi:transcriptional regulator with XRE-family HTH domain
MNAVTIFWNHTLSHSKSRNTDGRNDADQSALAPHNAPPAHDASPQDFLDSPEAKIAYANLPPVTENAIRSYLGQALQVVRVDRRISQRVLAWRLLKILGRPISTSWISKIESGSTGISVERLVALCAALNCSMSEVWRIAEFLAKRSIPPIDTYPPADTNLSIEDVSLLQAASVAHIRILEIDERSRLEDNTHGNLDETGNSLHAVEAACR